MIATEQQAEPIKLLPAPVRLEMTPDPSGDLCYWKVRVGSRWAILSQDEALYVVAQFLINGKRDDYRATYLKTDAEHAAQEAYFASLQTRSTGGMADGN